MNNIYDIKYYNRGVRLIDFLTSVDLCFFKKKLKINSKVLEIGCGNGKTAQKMADSFKIEAIDVSKIAIKIAKTTKSNASFFCGDVFDLKRPNSYYDAIYSFHVMEHVKNIEDTLVETKRILKVGGKLIVRIPNSDSLEAKIAGENWFHWDEPYHVNHWKYGEFVMLLKNCGFKNIKVNFGLVEYKQVLLYSIFSFLGIKVNRLAVLPLQIIFVPISLILGIFFKNSGTVEFVVVKN